MAHQQYCPPNKNGHEQSPMATVYENHQDVESFQQTDQKFSQSQVILNTHDHEQQVVESFAEHVDFCGEPFKEEILKKVLELKGNDYKILTSFVSHTRP